MSRINLTSLKLVKIKDLMSIPQNVFVLFAGIFGILFVFIVPPMQSPDEVEHLYRAYQVSEFNIKADPVNGGYGGILPISIVDAARSFKGTVAGHSNQKFDTLLLTNADKKPLNPDQQQKIRFDNTAIYSPIPYLPQAFGVGLARIFHANPLTIIYFGRVANLLVWIIFLYLSIRIVPMGKWAFVIIALNPVSIFLASTLSSDAVTVGLIALFVAIVIKFRVLPELPTKLQLLLIGVLPVLICLTKNAYIPVILLLLLLPQITLAWWRKSIILAIALTAGFGWNLMILPIAESIPSYFGMTTHIDKSAQIAGIINDPIRFIGVFTNNIFGQPSSVSFPSYDGLFGWLDTPNPYWVNTLFFVSLLLALFYRGVEPKKLISNITPKIKLYIGLITSLSIGALFLTLYVGYSQVNSGVIDGVQGRYFIPLTFFLVPVTLTNLIDIRISRKLLVYILYSMTTVVLLSTTVTLISRYY